MLGDEVVSSGIGAEICWFLGVFYADNGLIQSRDPALLQYSFNILVELFEKSRPPHKHNQDCYNGLCSEEDKDTSPPRSV